MNFPEHTFLWYISSPSEPIQNYGGGGGGRRGYGGGGGVRRGTLPTSCRPFSLGEAGPVREVQDAMGSVMSPSSHSSPSMLGKRKLL